ncbi:IS66 family insertion sequence element accessory protein TnpA [Terrimonas pollutisoli]|uniref:IS66 family insertion sequence element accessory protein TnpA n=1 Tax=Terrimonas pollutisoli TaxID=3034147 RepID=UPI0023EB3E2F|nr:hypothetical protein [Terrimonas sp. H1YJ31]
MEVLSAVKRRQFRRRSEILDLLREQQESGLSVRVFCAERSIAEGSFHNWKKRYGSEGSAANNNAFARVQVEAVAAGLFAEVNGIKLYQPVSAGYLKELVS